MQLTAAPQPDGKYGHVTQQLEQQQQVQQTQLEQQHHHLENLQGAVMEAIQELGSKIHGELDKVRAAQGEAGAQFTLLRSEMSTVKGKLSNLENGAQELSKYANNHDTALAHHGTVIAALEKRLKAVEEKPVPARKRTKTGEAVIVDPAVGTGATEAAQSARMPEWETLGR